MLLYLLIPSSILSFALDSNACSLLCLHCTICTFKLLAFHAFSIEAGKTLNLILIATVQHILMDNQGNMKAASIYFYNTVLKMRNTP